MPPADASPPAPPAPPQGTPCHGCDFQPGCAAFETLDALIYSKPSYRKPSASAPFLPAAKAQQILDLLDRCVEAWRGTVAGSSFPDELKRVSLPALFDLLMSGLYAWDLYDEAADELRREAFVHAGASEAWGYYPYLWMCPGCVGEGVEPASCYLPGATTRAGRAYGVKARLARPDGRRIGDFGALCIRAIVTALVEADAHFASGGGHRGELDLVVATDSLLVLGETKASPLVAFPVCARLPAEAAPHHQWTDPRPGATEWALYLAAAEGGARRLPIGEPGGGAWPLPDLLAVASDADQVEAVLGAWRRHLDGYRLFNAEDAATRWHRFGCGNIEGKKGTGAKATQLRVDNTKNLPGIDRTDDIKKGTAQIMLFDRLKRGCRAEAVKTVLFGNLYAETHHEHYVKPLASLKLQWPGHDPVWLFDGIVALSRNILNDPALEQLFSLKSEPYAADDPTPEELAEVARDDD